MLHVLNSSVELWGRPDRVRDKYKVQVLIYNDTLQDIPTITDTKGVYQPQPATVNDCTCMGEQLGNSVARLAQIK